MLEILKNLGFQTCVFCTILDVGCFVWARNQWTRLLDCSLWLLRWNLGFALLYIGRYISLCICMTCSIWKCEAFDNIVNAFKVAQKPTKLILKYLNELCIGKLWYKNGLCSVLALKHVSILQCYNFVSTQIRDFFLFMNT